MYVYSSSAKGIAVPGLLPAPAGRQPRSLKPLSRRTRTAERTRATRGALAAGRRRQLAAALVAAKSAKCACALGEINFAAGFESGQQNPYNFSAPASSPASSSSSNSSSDFFSSWNKTMQAAQQALQVTPAEQQGLALIAQRQSPPPGLDSQGRPLPGYTGGGGAYRQPSASSGFSAWLEKPSPISSFTNKEFWGGVAAVFGTLLLAGGLKARKLYRGRG